MKFPYFQTSDTLTKFEKTFQGKFCRNLWLPDKKYFQKPVRRPDILGEIDMSIH